MTRAPFVPRGPLPAAILIVAALLAPRAAAAQGTPETAAAATPETAAPPATTRPRPVSWTSDRLPLRVGDQVTILIDALTVAEADRDESALRERDRDLSVKAGSGRTTAGGNVRTLNDVSRAESGSSTRRERLATELSARVVEISPDGSTARIEGSRKVTIDKHQQEVTVRGRIRVADLGFDHTVESWRVADAEIAYVSNGALLKAGGLWSKLIDLVVP